MTYMQMQHEVVEEYNFTGEDWVKAEVSGCRFTNCIFDGVSMQEAKVVRCEFINCSLRRVNMRGTNFTDTIFPGCVFEPSDMFDVTLTMSCKLFENTEVSQLYWFCWLMIMAQATPPEHPVKANLKQLLISFIGDERYLKLREMFRRRDV